MKSVCLDNKKQISSIWKTTKHKRVKQNVAEHPLNIARMINILLKKLNTVLQYIS